MNSATTARDFETVQATADGVVYLGSTDGTHTVREGSGDFHEKMSVIGRELDRGPSAVAYLGGSVTGMQDDELRAWLAYGVRIGAFVCLDEKREVYVNASYEA